MSNPRLLSGRRTTLRALRSSDLDWLYALMVKPEVRGRWRTGGYVPSPSDFERALSYGSEIQFVVCRRDNVQQHIGLVQAYDMDPRSGTASIAALFDVSLWSAGWPLEGVLIFLHHMFSVVGLRKLYFDVPEGNLATFQSALGRFLTVEAELRDHDYRDGAYLTRTILALDHSRWPEQRVLEITGLAE